MGGGRTLCDLLVVLCARHTQEGGWVGEVWDPWIGWEVSTQSGVAEVLPRRILDKTDLPGATVRDAACATQ